MLTGEDFREKLLLTRKYLYQTLTRNVCCPDAYRRATRNARTRWRITGAQKKKYQQVLKTYRKTEAVSGEVLHDPSWMMLRMFATGQIHCVHQFHLML